MGGGGGQLGMSVEDNEEDGVGDLVVKTLIV